MLCATVLSLFPAIWLCIHFLFMRVLLPSPQTLTEVVQVLQPVPASELEDLFDVRIQDNLYTALSNIGFRKVRPC